MDLEWRGKGDSVMGNKAISAARRMRIWVRDGLRCYYCSRACLVHGAPGCDKRNMATLDHMIPLMRGGGDADDNLVTACASCNASKKTKTSEEYFSWKLETSDWEETRL